VGPLGKGAKNWGDGDVNADCGGIGLGWGEKVYRNIEGLTVWMVRNTLGRFLLNVMFGAVEAGKGGK
jgi:hypothetical protein